MKKILFAIAFISTVSFGFASECYNFYYGTVCVDIEKVGNGEYKLQRTLKNARSVENNIYDINCEILLPNGKLKDMGACNQTFEYTSTKSGEVKLYVYFQGENGIIKYNYDFGSGLGGNNLTSKQSKELNTVYKLWPRLITTLQDKYPILSRNKSWIQESEEIYDKISDYYKGKDTYIKSYSQFEKLVIDFVKYTKSLISK